MGVKFFVLDVMTRLVVQSGSIQFPYILAIPWRQPVPHQDGELISPTPY